MFGADYPFESAQEAGEFLDHVPLATQLRDDIACNNADPAISVSSRNA